MTKGIFITFEGIDGCGKSTQLAMTKEWLINAGYDVLQIREPGGTVVGEKIRGILLDKKNDSMVSLAELLLYEAARAQITEEIIKPALEEGKVVISDRFFDSTYAYQGHARELGDDLVNSLNLIATNNLEPDVTLLLDITPEEALKRRQGRGEAEDRLEALGTSFQAKVREGYLQLASSVDRVKVVDASCSIEEIQSQIRNYIQDLIKV